MAGRITFIEITPFSLDETHNFELLWTQGGFPKSYLLEQKLSLSWRENYMRTYIEQDLVILGLGFQSDVLRKLWFMLAHYHGQIVNYSDLSSSLGVSQPTIKKYMSYLTGSFMLRTLKPWHENLKKKTGQKP